MRDLGAAMDAAVFSAYGWSDLIAKSACRFLIDFEDDAESSEGSMGRKRRKPWRFRWSDELRDEVLARLLKLNAERAEEEHLAGMAVAFAEQHTPLSGKKLGKGRRGIGVSPTQPELLPPPQGDLFA